MKKRRSVGGLRIRGIKPRYDENLGEYYATCPEDCGHVMKENDIHPCEERTYIFSMGTRKDEDLV